MYIIHFSSYAKVIFLEWHFQDVTFGSEIPLW